MHVGFYTAQVQAQVQASQGQSVAAYERLPDKPLSLAFVDLASSSNYRLKYGPKAGYVRSEMFFSLIRSVIEPCGSVSLVKEIGDEVLLCSDDFRRLLECVILIVETSFQLARISEEKAFPFGVRAAIGYGVVKKLRRAHEDYLGSAIDQLARAMSVRSEATPMILHEDAFVHWKDIFREYDAFLRISDVKSVPQASQKGMLKHVMYREMLLDRDVLLAFKEGFVPWRETTGGGRVEE